MVSSEPGYERFFALRRLGGLALAGASAKVAAAFQYHRSGLATSLEALRGCACQSKTPKTAYAKKRS